MFVFMALAEKYDNRAYRYRPIFAAWLLLSLVTIVLVFYDYKQFKINPMTALMGQAAGVVSLLQHGTSLLQAGYNLQVESIRATVQLPEVRGPVDLYPDNLAIVAALDLPYNPRPSVISHGAYTPLMARLDAEHLTGSRQPETILFDVDTIDNRYAPIDDGLSWPELWTRYEVDTVSKFFVVLSHLEKPSTYTMSKIREDSIKFGSKLDLPGIENGLIWAEIDMQKTMPGRFGVIAFKLPEVQMTVTFRNGQAQTYRVIPEMLKTGFLLSPYINSKHLFVDAMDRRWAEILKQHEIRDITFQLENWWGKTSSPGLYYKDDIKVSLYRLDFPRQDVWKKLGVRTEDIIELTTLFGSASGCYDKRFTTDTLTGKRVLLAHANCELRLPVTKNLSNLKVSFGLMESAYSDEGRAGAVEFRISAVTSGGGRKIVFSRNLDPLAVHGDRGEKEAIVKFSGGNNVKELVFETLTKGKTRWADSYWSRVSPQYK
jgi:hypothetical protein